MTLMAKERFFVKVEVSPDVRARFERLYTRRGLTQIEAATRVFEWFMRQDEMVQQAIFGQLPKSLMDQARQMLAKSVIPIQLDADRAAEDAHFDEVTEEIRTGKAGRRKGA